MNLASNSAKFTDRGHILLGAEAHGRGVRIAVSDTGCGIHADDLPRLFVPFGQLEDAHTKTPRRDRPRPRHHPLPRDAPRRTRLVASRRGEGSTFTLELPASSHDDRRRRPT